MIPETYARKDWPRLVKAANDKAVKRLSAAEGATAALDTRVDTLETGTISRASLWFLT